MTDEWWTVWDLEGHGVDQIDTLSWHLPAGPRNRNKTTQAGYTVSCPGFEPNLFLNSNLQCCHCTNLFVHWLKYLPLSYTVKTFCSVELCGLWVRSVKAKLSLPMRHFRRNVNEFKFCSIFVKYLLLRLGKKIFTNCEPLQNNAYFSNRTQLRC
jgi:hypothetical protein